MGALGGVRVEDFLTALAGGLEREVRKNGGEFESAAGFRDADGRMAARRVVQAAS